MHTITVQDAETMTQQIIAAATAAGIPDGEISDEIIQPAPGVTWRIATCYFPSGAFRYRVFVECDPDETDADISVVAYDEDPTTPWPEDFYDVSLETPDQVVDALLTAQAEYAKYTGAQS